MPLNNFGTKIQAYAETCYMPGILGFHTIIAFKYFWQVLLSYAQTIVTNADDGLFLTKFTPNLYPGCFGRVFDSVANKVG